MRTGSRMSDLLYRDIFSELDMLSSSIKEMPQKGGFVESFVKRYFWIIALAVVFGTGFTMGDLRLFSPNGYINYSIQIVDKKEVIMIFKSARD